MYLSFIKAKNRNETLLFYSNSFNELKAMALFFRKFVYKVEYYIVLDLNY